MVVSPSGACEGGPLLCRAERSEAGPPCSHARARAEADANVARLRTSVVDVRARTPAVEVEPDVEQRVGDARRAEDEDADQAGPVRWDTDAARGERAGGAGLGVRVGGDTGAAHRKNRSEDRALPGATIGRSPDVPCRRDSDTRGMRLTNFRQRPNYANPAAFRVSR